jgi:hypothetical protein
MYLSLDRRARSVSIPAAVDVEGAAWKPYLEEVTPCPILRGPKGLPFPAH